jgi:hypothetical protein
MKKFLIFSSMFVLPISSCLYFINFKSQEPNKDETRFNSNYYGMNWGSRTDEIVRIKIKLY